MREGFWEMGCQGPGVDSFQTDQSSNNKTAGDADEVPKPNVRSKSHCMARRSFTIRYLKSSPLRLAYDEVLVPGLLSAPQRKSVRTKPCNGYSAAPVVVVFVTSKWSGLHLSNLGVGLGWSNESWRNLSFYFYDLFQQNWAPVLLGNGIWAPFNKKVWNFVGILTPVGTDKWTDSTKIKTKLGFVFIFVGPFNFH